MTQMKLSTIQNGFIDIENRLMVAKGMRGGEEMGWELHILVSICKLVCIEWINNKGLLYSTGNYIRYSVIYIYI